MRILFEFSQVWCFNCCSQVCSLIRVGIGEPKEGVGGQLPGVRGQVEGVGGQEEGVGGQLEGVGEALEREGEKLSVGVWSRRLSMIIYISIIIYIYLY